jgi:general secretion pathway protein G
MFKLPKNKGFTLIELMVVITVIAILSTIVLFGIGKAQASARDTSRQTIMNGVRAALERYYGDNQAYPATTWNAALTALIAGGYLAADPIDPCTKVAVVRASGTSVCGTTTVTYAYGSAAGTCTGSPTTGYTLSLIKESGGTSYFCSPQ